MRPGCVRVTVLCKLLLTATSCSAPPATPAADLTADAKAFVMEVSSGAFAKAVARFDATMTGALPETKLREVWDGLLAKAGAFRAQGPARAERAGAYDVVYVGCQFERATLDAKVVFNAAGKISGLFFVPPARAADVAPASYVSPEAFTEADFEFGAPPWILPGTLAIPKGDGPFPAMVLVHGSGPQDRDETVGANKPFRDIAQGLASRGIAVLRYEKRTLHYAARLQPLPLPFTVGKETVDDAVAAVRALRTTPRIDEKRVFVLGHSLGGTLIPRIAGMCPGAAGFIILAGTTRPLADVILEQTRYLALLDGKKTDDEQKQIDAVRAQTDRVRELMPADAADPSPILGAPASYWLDLRDYRPAEAAKRIQRPLLIMQGERDYQVTMSDFAQWRSALSGHANVTLKTYPGLNHLFERGSGPGNPSEYTRPGHVDKELIDDITAWVLH